MGQRSGTLGSELQLPVMLSTYRMAGERDNHDDRQIADVWAVHGAAMAFTRPLWEELSGFDEGFFPAYWEESDFCERARQAGRRVDETSPMVDSRLPDGSRLNAIIPPLALDGALVSVRRLSRKLDALTQSYWELRYDYTRLRSQLARLDPGEAGETEPADRGPLHGV